MAMTTEVGTQTSAESSALNPALAELFYRSLLKEKPQGDALFVKLNDLSSGRVATNAGIEFQPSYNLEETLERLRAPKRGRVNARRFAAIVIETPPLTPDSKKELEKIKLLLRFAPRMLKREIGKPGGRVSRSAPIFIMEERGLDMIKDWREEILKDSPLAKPQVLTPTNKDFIIWEARHERKSDRETTNTFETRLGPRAKDDLQRNRNARTREGYERDDTALVGSARATKVLPRAAGDIEGYNHGVTLTSDREIVTFDERGNKFVSPIPTGQDYERPSPSKTPPNKPRTEQKPTDLDPSIQQAINNPGRNFKSDRLECNKPNCKGAPFRRAETVETKKGRIKMLYNMCPEHGILSKGKVPQA